MKNLVLNEKKSSIVKLAVLGFSGCGKSTLIGSTFKDKEFASKLSGDRGTTKVSVHYAVKLCNEDKKLNIKDVKWNEALFKYTKDNAESNLNEIIELMNDVLEQDKQIMNDITNNLTIESVRKYFIKNTIEKYGILKYINKKKGDKFNKLIKSITVTIPASEEFFKLMKKYGYDEVIFKDTRGFLDEDINSKNNEISLLSMGIDDVDACIFVNNDKQNFTEQIDKQYGDIIREIVKSIPMFLLEQSDVLDIYMSDNNNISFEKYEEYIVNKGYKRNFKYFDKFINTFGELKSQLIKKDDMKLLLPRLDNETIEIGAYNSCNYMRGSEFVFEKVLKNTKLVMDASEKAYKILTKGQNIEKNKEYILNICVSQYNSLTNNIIREIINPNVRNNTLVRQCGRKYSPLEEIKFLISTNTNILGPRGGITDSYYSHTQMMAVTSYLIINKIIDKLISKECVDGILRLIIDVSNESESSLEIYRKQIIQYFQKCMYGYSDWVCLSGRFLVNRYVVKKYIEKLSKIYNGEVNLNDKINFYIDKVKQYINSNEDIILILALFLYGELLIIKEFNDKIFEE